jgi:hypothetical protein
MDLTLESIHQSGFELESELYSSAREGMVAGIVIVTTGISDLASLTTQSNTKLKSNI